MRKVLLLFFVLTLWAPQGAVAHDDDSPELAELFFQLPENGFYLRPIESEPAATSYVRLADGTHYPLNSAFWQAVENLVANAKDDPNADIIPVKRSIVARVREMASTHFWMDLGVMGTEMFTRYGPFTFAMIATAEVIEHSLWPGPPLCVAIQAGCLLWSQQLREIWNAARYRYPLDRSGVARTVTGISVIKARYRFWRAMRLVFQEDGNRVTSKPLFKRYLTSPPPIEALVVNSPFWGALLKEEPAAPQSGHNEPMNMAPFFAPLDESAPPMARFFAAEEQVAFMNLQVQLAKQALDSVPMGFFISLRLRVLTAKLGRALDRYGMVIRQMAFSRMTAENKMKSMRAIDDFVNGYFEFNTKLAAYLMSVRDGLLPIGTAERARLFSLPTLLNKQLKVFQRRGGTALLDDDDDCEDLLAGE